jgi:hypothetical protein
MLQRTILLLKLMKILTDATQQLNGEGNQERGRN